MSHIYITDAKIIVLREHVPYKEFGADEADDANELVGNLGSWGTEAGIQAVVTTHGGTREKYFSDADDAAEWIDNQLEGDRVVDLRKKHSPVTVTMLRNKVHPKIFKSRKNKQYYPVTKMKMVSF